MPDYRELYFTLFRATARAAELLVEAQRECEELFLSSEGADIREMPLPLGEGEKGARARKKGSARRKTGAGRGAGARPRAGR